MNKNVHLTVSKQVKCVGAIAGRALAHKPLAEHLQLN